MQDYIFSIDTGDTYEDKFYYTAVTAASMFEACVKLEKEADRLRSLDGVVLNGYIECVGVTDHIPSTVEGVIGPLCDMLEFYK